MDDWWKKLFKKSWRPFSSRFMFEDIDESFNEMRELMEREFQDISKRAPKDLIRERTLPNGSKVREWGPFVYGYSVTMGPDGKPKVREFGNFKPESLRGRPKFRVKEQREPLVDVMEEEKEVKVIAELPGVEKKDIKLFGTENSLTISVETPRRKYFKEVSLPKKIDQKQAKSTYKNGVLEVTLTKKEEDKKPKGEPITIE